VLRVSGRISRSGVELRRREERTREFDPYSANAVAPGPTETELFRENNPKGSEGEKRYLAKVAMARLANPEEIAAAIAFLGGENAEFITG
jgi:NAD(P)-dependent dehydrogenase (short-subunit alcohol dehydrogenase family)